MIDQLGDASVFDGSLRMVIVRWLISSASYAATGQRCFTYPGDQLDRSVPSPMRPRHR